MSKHRPSSINEDYVRFQNDKKQKKLTVKHLTDQLRSIESHYNQRSRWIEKDIAWLRQMEGEIAVLKGRILDATNAAKA